MILSSYTGIQEVLSTREIYNHVELVTKPSLGENMS